MLWLDGQIVEGTRAPLDFGDRGLLLGDGVFDTALSIEGRIVFEKAHRARLEHALATLGIPVEPARLTEAMRAVAGASTRASIRTTVTRGSGPRGLAPLASVEPLIFAQGAEARPGLAFAPMRLTRSAIRRNETSPTAHLKTLCYLDAVFAARDAMAAGFDDAVFLNGKGRVACTGTGNLFALVDGALVTPAREEGVLPGIVRGEILTIAGQLGIRVEERTLLPDELARARACFVTNSLRLVAPVTAIDGVALNSQSDETVVTLSGALRARIAESVGATTVELG